jgi:hypothetical protein
VRTIHPSKQTSQIRVLAVLLMICTASGTAHAQQQLPPAAAAVKQACAADYQALCSNVQPGGGRILACLRQNADKVSPACKQALANAQAARRGGS